MHLYASLFAVAVAGFAQQFEVASVKPNHSGDRRMSIMNRPGGRFVTENVTLKQLVTFAYGVHDYQVSGLPGWADSDRFDINAKAENVSPEEALPMTKMPSDTEVEERQKKLQAMLQNLLAERFGLKVHRETREMPVYALVIAKGGSKLVEAKEDAPPLVGGPKDRGPGGPPPLPFRAPLMRMGRGELVGQELRIAEILRWLSTVTGRAVIDKTGLSGKYDITLKWTPDEPQSGIARDGGNEAPRPEAADSAPSLFTALQEQLGLKLESQKGPVEQIVIDHIEKLTEN